MKLCGREDPSFLAFCLYNSFITVNNEVDDFLRVLKMYVCNDDIIVEASHANQYLKHMWARLSNTHIVILRAGNDGVFEHLLQTRMLCDQLVLACGFSVAVVCKRKCIYEGNLHELSKRCGRKLITAAISKKE